jgi:hypothetical protein
MVSMRQYYKFLLFIIPAAIIWTQFLVAEHDQLSHYIADDCVICKIAETGNDKANFEDVLYSGYYYADTFLFFLFIIFSSTNLWVRPLTRAPPTS